MKKNTVLTVKTSGTLLPFLLENLKGQSRNNIKSLLTHRQILVNGKLAARYDCPLEPGQRVEICWSKTRGEENELEIIYEDENIIAVNKPAGLLSIANENEKENTAYHMLTDYVRHENPKARIFVVHRLDKDTSGVLLVAKNEPAKRAFQDNWNDIVTRREYIAIVEGTPEKARGSIRSHLRETKTHLVYSSETGGVVALTNYEVMKEAADYSMLRVQISTGRKNQIRVHMKDLGHPIAGDKKYGAKTSPLRRLALHAHILELINPMSGQSMQLLAKIPKGFHKLTKTQSV